jgi:superfamily II DNA/RNA helicase
MTFKELNMADSILEAISYMGFTQATPIQEQAIPKILEGRDLIACAQTGTGKTAAFVLPIIQKLGELKEHKGTNTLVVVPTRELAVQIHQQIQGFSYFTNVHSAVVYGGGNAVEFEQQKEALTNGTDIIVATPGKLLSHLMLGYVKFDHVEHLVLDEADRMLDMGFVEDILRIIDYLPKKRQNLMFSATMAPKIRMLVKRILHEPVEISLSIAKPAEGVTQIAYLTHDEQKLPLARKILEEHPDFTSILIFTSTKIKVSSIVRGMRSKNYELSWISSDLEQDEREKVLQGFAARRIRVLVATDVLSRGIDIKDINLVLNYDVPRNAEDYVHRVGRTARSDTKGMAITFVNPQDMRAFADIEKLIERELPKEPLPEGFGPGPEWNPKGGGGDRNRNRRPGGGGGNAGGGKKPFRKFRNDKPKA